MNRGEWQDLFNWAWNEVWPKHLGQPLLVGHNPEDQNAESRSPVTEALALTAELYEQAREKGWSHEDAKHRAYEGIMRIAHPPPPPPPSTLRPLSGPVRIKDGSFADDTGSRLITMCHAGDLAMRSSYDWDGAMRALDAIRDAGYHGLRTWDRLRWGGTPGEKPGIYGDWGHEVSNSWGPQIRRFVEACRDRELRLHLAAGDLNKLSRAGCAAYFQARKELTEAYPNTIILNEWANESRDTASRLGPVDAARDMAELIRLRPLVGLTAYTGHEDAKLFEQWTPAWMEFCLVHGYRGGHWWDKLRHIFSLPYEIGTRRLWLHGEPFGPGKLVSASDHKDELTDAVMGMAAAQCWITGGWWTFFSSPGVVLGDERFEDQPGFSATPKVAGALEQVAQEFGGVNWGKLRLTHGGKGRPNILELDRGNSEHARIDQVVDDGRRLMFATVYSPQPVTWSSKVDGLQLRRIDPETGEVAEVPVGLNRLELPAILVGAW